MMQIAYLEHMIDKAIAGINRTNRSWISSWAKGPPRKGLPMRIPQKLAMIAEYFASSPTDVLPNEFFDEVEVVFDHRRWLSHGGFWGFQVSPTSLDTHFFFSRFAFGKSEAGKRTINFENRVLEDDTLIAIIERCGALSALLRQAVPAISSIEEEITTNFESFDEETAVWLEVQTSGRSPS